jgi:nucleoside-diphosphate-sugar epimerase
MSKTILVAGGAGFIGSHLCEILTKKNNEIICIDNLKTGHIQNIKHLLSKPNFTFIKSDICSDLVFKKLKQKPIDQIYHLASPASVTYVTKFPVETALTNSIGTKNILEFAKLKNSRIIFASSSEAYGDPQKHPQPETYWGNVNPIGVRSGYDESKRFSEALSMAYHREFGVSIGIARIFNTYGPNSSKKDSRVIPQFVIQALQNNKLTIHGDGTQTRSFCYVTDTASGLVKLMNSSHTGPFNIGNADEYKIKQVAELIIKLTKSKSKITFVKRPEDDPTLRRPDLTKTKKSLVWTAKISFNEGLNNTIQYFKKILPQNYD